MRLGEEEEGDGRGGRKVGGREAEAKKVRESGRETRTRKRTRQCRRGKGRREITRARTIQYGRGKGRRESGSKAAFLIRPPLLTAHARACLV